MVVMPYRRRARRLREIGVAFVVAALGLRRRFHQFAFPTVIQATAHIDCQCFGA
jgi:hypothetical protein